jgi:predicted kinase
VRKQLAGIAPTERVRDASGKGLYRPEMTRCTYAALVRRAGRWLRNGRSVVLDATYASPDERAVVRRLAASFRAGTRLITFVCRVDDEVLQRRLAARELGPSGPSDARPELWSKLRTASSAPMEMPQAVVVSTVGPPASAVSQVMAVLADPDRCRGEHRGAAPAEVVGRLGCNQVRGTSDRRVD